MLNTLPDVESKDIASLLSDRHASLRSAIRRCGSMLVAYSGGVDSALVAFVAHQELPGKALAAMGISPSYPERERRAATLVAEFIGIPCRLVETHEQNNPEYVANPVNRCFHCKSELYDRLLSIAGTEQFAVVADGVNATDLTEDRPSLPAARQRGIRSPLAEAQLTKGQVRQLAKALGLPVWDKPSMPCLASRVPHGTPVTPELLKHVEQAEDVLAALGFRQFRVRHHGQIARLELAAEDFPLALALKDKIVAGVRKAGYRFVALDLMGYQNGSAHTA